MAIKISPVEPVVTLEKIKRVKTFKIVPVKNLPKSCKYPVKIKMDGVYIKKEFYDDCPDVLGEGIYKDVPVMVKSWYKATPEHKKVLEEYLLRAWKQYVEEVELAQDNGEKVDYSAIARKAYVENLITFWNPHYDRWLMERGILKKVG